MKCFSGQNKNALLTFAFAIVISACVCKPIDKPNVVIAYVDDLSKGVLSVYDQKVIETPKIDRLIQNGLSVANSCFCAYCAKEKASLTTGFSNDRADKWSIFAGMRYFDVQAIENAQEIEGKIDESDVLLLDDDLYLSRVFQLAGCVTAQIGKLDYGFSSTRHCMKRMGWNYCCGYFDHVRCHGCYPPFLWENGLILKIDGNTSRNCGESIRKEAAETFTESWDVEEKNLYAQDLFMEKTLGSVEKHLDKPFPLMHATPFQYGPMSVPKVNPSVTNDLNLIQIEKDCSSLRPKVINDVNDLYDVLSTFSDRFNIDLPVAKDGLSLKDLVVEGRNLTFSREVSIASSAEPSIIRNDGYKLRFIEPAVVYELFNLKNDYQECKNLAHEKVERDIV
jgi:Arylsulfatase A and related enzymes